MAGPCYRSDEQQFLASAVSGLARGQSNPIL
jgi:hypothetical protein